MSDSEKRNKLGWLLGMVPIVAVISGLLSIPYYLGQFGVVNLGHHEQPLTHTISIESSAKLAVSAAETSAWRAAFDNRKNCDAIRQYILSYPDGHFVASAQSILAARRQITKVRWVPFEYPSNVVASSSLEARTSREAACKSARAQLLQNMADGCSIFIRDPKYRSVVVDAPSNANCDCEDSAIQVGNNSPPVDPVWRCSIRSTYRCRGEQMERVTDFSCD
jgi:hypothetical protein